MRCFERSAAVLFISCGLALLSAVPLTAAGNGGYQEGESQQHLRGVVDRTQNDLQAASQLEQRPKERERYRHAQERLSDFDRKLSRGHFDNGKLKNAIGAIEDILNHNTLQPSTRDALRADLADLQAVRDRHEH